MRVLVNCRLSSYFHGIMLITMVFGFSLILMLYSRRNVAKYYYLEDQEMDYTLKTQVRHQSHHFLIKDPEVSSESSLACFPEPLGMTDEEFYARYPLKTYGKCPAANNIIFHENG